MSHPSADPAVNAVAARLVGLATADPSRARVLELGCGSGHHLLPLAARWPEAEFEGVDRDGAAVELARGLAAEGGLANARFHEGGFEDGGPAEGGEFDFIIAHGVFSWVPDEAKLALLRRIAERLGPRGVAVVSFNVAAGWRRRLPLVEKARAIQAAGGDGVELMRALEILRDVCESDDERLIVDDMRAKGAAVLAHDDFAPVNDPFSLKDFVALAAHHGLRWLGEGVPADNRAEGGAVVDGAAFAGDPVGMHEALDEAGDRTFRSALLCRADAEVAGRVPASAVADCFLSAGPAADGRDAALAGELAAAAPGDAHAGELIQRHGPAMATRIVKALYDGTAAARTHAADVRRAVPEAPRMDGLRLACARRGLPVVDARHRPCEFPRAHLELLAMMDGSRRLDGLSAIARERCPELAFGAWMRHLAQRGFFL